MQFSLDQFYRLNRRIFIWLLLFLLIWLLRDFFGLVFLTFVLAFVAVPLVQFGHTRLRLPRRLAIVVVYVLFLLTLVSVITFVAPRVVREAGSLITRLEQLEGTLIDLKIDLVTEYPALKDAIPGYLESALSEGEDEDKPAKNYRDRYERKLKYLRHENLSEQYILYPETIPTSDTLTLSLLDEYQARRDELLIGTFLEQQIDLVGENVPLAIKLLHRALVTTLLAWLFSFLISMDISRLGQALKSLSASHLRDFYAQTARPVVRFAYVIGRAIRAQAMIACANTVLTLVSLVLLGIPSLAMLSVMVFFCSFVPVLGVFISTTPIVLVALNSGGFGLAVSAIFMVMGIHIIEAYMLNPLIFGQHFKINPVLVLIILFIGHHTFGLWGMVLGVPVTYYFLHDVFGVPIWGEHRMAPTRETTAHEAPAHPLSGMPRSENPATTNPSQTTHSDAARMGHETEPD